MVMINYFSSTFDQALRWNHLIHPWKPTEKGSLVSLKEKIAVLALVILLSIPTYSLYGLFVLGTAFWKNRKIQPEKIPPPEIRYEDLVPYKHEEAIQNVLRAAEKCAAEGKKFCLYLGRQSHQSLPLNPQEIWVSFDYELVKKIPKGRLHLLMNINDLKETNKIYQLFDKVMLDLSCLKFVQEGGDPWAHMSRQFLKPAPSSELITEACTGINGTNDNLEKTNYCLGTFIGCKNFNQDATYEELYHKNRMHLCTLFDEVKFFENAPYPRPENDKATYYVLRSPKQRSAEKVRIPQFDHHYPLHRAAALNDVIAIRNILELSPASHEETWSYGAKMAPLHYAVWYGNLEAVKALVDGGADINQKDEKRRTPLDLAEVKEKNYQTKPNEDVIKFLKEKGALSNRDRLSFLVFYTHLTLCQNQLKM